MRCDSLNPLVRTVRFVLIAGFAVLFNASQLPAQSAALIATQDASEAQQRLAAYLETLKEGRDFPGVSAAVVLPDGQVITATVGDSSIEDDTPLNADDLLFSGSIGKTYFAAMALHLALQDRLDLDKPVAEYLGESDWFERIPNHADITVRHLMQHRSGIPRYILAEEFWQIVTKDPDHLWANGDQLKFVYDADALHPAGQGWAYSDTNYILLGLILEKVTDETAYAYIQRELLAPHELKFTVPTNTRTIPSLAQGYTSLFRSFGLEGPVVRDGQYFVNPSFEWGGGGFANRTSDLARWAHIYFSGAAFEGDYLQLMLADAADSGRMLGPGSKYGLGVILRETKLGPSRGHDGVFPGYLSAMAYFPEHQSSAAIQFNTDDGRSIGRPPAQTLAEMIAAVNAVEQL